MPSFYSYKPPRPFEQAIQRSRKRRRRRQLPNSRDRLNSGSFLSLTEDEPRNCIGRFLLERGDRVAVGVESKGYRGVAEPF